MNTNKMIAKVRVLAVSFGMFVLIAALTAAVEFTGTVDWPGLGVFGPAIGAAIAAGLNWALSYAKRSDPEDLMVIRASAGMEDPPQS